MSYRHRAAPAVNLFPMFNILVCTLGVLIFVLFVVVTLSLGAGRSVRVIPEGTGSARAKVPLYVEWTGTRLVAHPAGDSVEFPRSLRSIPTFPETYKYIEVRLTGTAVGAALDEVSRSKDTRYVVVLVRPSGFESFREIKGYFESKKIDLGYEPIDQGWSVRLQ
jgi:hypothetical protein